MRTALEDHYEPGLSLWHFLYNFWIYGVTPKVMQSGSTLWRATMQTTGGAFANVGSSMVKVRVCARACVLS